MSFYSTLKHRNDQLRNQGYDYRGRILLDNSHSFLFKNKIMTEFGTYLEEIINHWIYSVKSIKKKIDFLQPKDSDSLN